MRRVLLICSIGTEEQAIESCQDFGLLNSNNNAIYAVEV